MTIMLPLVGGSVPFDVEVEETYSDLVNNLSPDWYLPLSDPSGTTATAQVGPNGTYQNSPQLAVDSIADLDASGKSVGLSGDTTNAHHITVSSPLSGPDLTIDMIVQLDDLTKAKHLLITTLGGFAGGEFSVEVLQDGQLRAWSSDGSPRVILGTVGDVPQGTAVKISYQRQTGGSWSQRVLVDGVVKAEDVTVRTWPSVPAGTVYVGTWWTGSAFVDPVDGLLGHIVGWNSVLTSGQLQGLIRTKSIAWAEDIDAGNVVVSQSKPVMVTQAGWHGKLPLTVTAGDGSLVTTTESGDTVTIDAGAVEGDDDTFTYSFTDDNGNISPTKTITIDVTSAPVSGAQLGVWPLSETSGTTFADTVGGNSATLTVPSWTLASHELDRPGIVVGTDHALEVSNGGPSIPMIAGYKNSAMTLVLYVEPRGELRGVQYWDESDERFGREFLAYCDDGSTPGSFAIYRRRNGVAGLVGISGTREWRLGGYVRNSAGAKVYFGGSVTGIAGALLPVDTAKRIVLTQGPAGATLFLDDTQVANLGSVTEGWASLTTPITLGSSSSTGHANDRSPFWGRLDQIEIWQGQRNLTQVQALADATQSLPYKLPTDGPLVNIASHGNDIQAAIDAAASVGGYAYQDETADTAYKTLGATTTLQMKAGCRGMVGIRARRPSNQNSSSRRMMHCSDSSNGGSIPTSAGDPWAASGGWKFIGCKFDGNARGQSWAPTSSQASADGKANSRFDFQFAHCFQVDGSSSTRITVTLDACEFYDNTGDGVSLSMNAKCTAKSCRFYGTFRGPFIYNEFTNQDTLVKRCEMHTRGDFSGSYANMGCGLCDLEPFEPSTSLFNHWTIVDSWCESDWDDRNYEIDGSIGSWSKYYNCHMTGSVPVIQPDRTGSDTAGNNRPTREVLFQRCTIGFYKKAYRSNGTTSTGNFPPCMIKGFTPGPNGTGALFEECVFIANGRPMNYHEFGIADPAIDVSPSCALEYQLGHGPTGKLMTLRNCQFRTTRLSHVPTANTKAIQFPGGMGTSRQIEFDGVTIDEDYADAPFNFNGATIRYRNVLHERTGDTTPWTGAGAEVPI